jgi:solute:Na+ symporter, SSS family
MIIREGNMETAQYEYAWLIIAAIIVILLVRLGIGFWASRRVQTSVDFVLAGRRLPLWMAAPSIMATWFAAETLMGSSAEAYKYGFQGVVFDPFGATMCLLIAGFLVVRLARRAKYVTIMDFFQNRYGKTMSVVGTFTQIITYFGWTAAQIVAGGSILHVLLGWPIATGMIMVTAIVTFYTILGGLWADTALDFMQMFLTCAGVLVIFFAIVSSVGGLGEFLGMAGSQEISEPFALWPTEEDGYLGYDGTSGMFYYVAAWLALGLGAIPAQDYLQRTCASKNEATAVKATYIAAGLYLFFGVLSPLIGLAAFSALGPDLAAEQTEFLIVSMAMKFLPPVLTALFVAALASALMSTSDSSLLAGATLFTENLVKVFKPDLSDRAQLLLTRSALLVSGAVSLTIALYAATIYKLAVLSNSVILVGMAAPYIIGLYWKKANQLGALAAFFAGALSWIVLAFYYYNNLTLDACAFDVECGLWDAVYIASTPAFLVSVIFFLGISLLTQKLDPPKVLTDIDGKPLDTRNPFGFGNLSDVLDEDESIRLAPAD